MSHTLSARTLPPYYCGLSDTQSASQIHRTYKIQRDNLVTLTLSPTISAISKLGTRFENWDGRGSAKPDAEAIQHAMALAEQMCNCVSAMGVGKYWVMPHVSASEDGEVTFEWWRGTHKLTIYIGPKRAEYIKVWGLNVETEMSDGELVGSQFQGLWLWLNA